MGKIHLTTCTAMLTQVRI